MSGAHIIFAGIKGPYLIYKYFWNVFLQILIALIGQCTIYSNLFQMATSIKKRTSPRWSVFEREAGPLHKPAQKFEMKLAFLPSINEGTDHYAAFEQLKEQTEVLL